MNILLLVSELPPARSGVASSAKLLIEHYRRMGHELDAITMRSLPKLIWGELRLSFFFLRWPSIRRQLAATIRSRSWSGADVQRHVLLLMRLTMTPKTRPKVIYTHHFELDVPGFRLLSRLYNRPNRLASFSENPYHFKEYRPEELRELLEPLFPSVEILGVFGNERVRTLQSSRRRQVTRILRLDPFGLRGVLPQPIRKWAFAKLARFVRRRMRADHLESFGELGPSDFTIGQNPLEESLDLLAICRK